MGCLTHASVIEGPESRAADPALEGSEGVDADAFGTGSGISALVYICSTRRRTGGSVENNRGLELVAAPKQRANGFWTFNPPGSHFSGEKQTGGRLSVSAARPVTFAEAPPGLGVAVVALAGVRSLRVDTIAVLALAGHAALVDVCQFGGEPEGGGRGR